MPVLASPVTARAKPGDRFGWRQKSPARIGPGRLMAILGSPDPRRSFHPSQMNTTEHDNTRWLALYVLCAGMLMIVLDATIVNVALPSIQDDLGFSQNNLAW